MLGWITTDSKIFGGKPAIRGTRVSVEPILSLLAQGEGVETILDDDQGPEPDDTNPVRRPLPPLLINHETKTNDSKEPVDV